MLKAIFSYLIKVCFMMPMTLLIVILGSLALWIMSVFCLEEWWGNLLTNKFGEWKYTAKAKG